MNNTELRIGGVPVEKPRPAVTDAASAGDMPAGASDAPGSLRDKVEAMIREVYDPEIPVNIYELGLIYDIKIEEPTTEDIAAAPPGKAGAKVTIQMTLTSPACPVAESLPLDVRRRVGTIAEVGEVEIDLTFEPPWGPEKMSEVAKLKLGML